MSAKDQPKGSDYIPPLRFHALTPAYDALVRWTCAERQFRDAMLEALAGARFSRLVDVGCGTGSLLTALCGRFPGAEIIGIDADEAALRLAATKIQRSGCVASLRVADARHLPFPDGWAQAFTSSLFFHHLEDCAKDEVLQEVRRCLSPGGVFVIADWDRATSAVKRAMFSVVRGLDGFGVTRAHAEGQFGEVIVRSGFTVREKTSICAPLGEITVWTCQKSVER